MPTKLVKPTKLFIASKILKLNLHCLPFFIMLSWWILTLTICNFFNNSILSQSHSQSNIENLRNLNLWQKLYIYIISTIIQQRRNSNTLQENENVLCSTQKNISFKSVYGTCTWVNKNLQRRKNQIYTYFTDSSFKIRRKKYLKEIKTSFHKTHLLSIWLSNNILLYF